MMLYFKNFLFLVEIWTQVFQILLKYPISYIMLTVKALQCDVTLYWFTKQFCEYTFKHEKEVPLNV